MALAILFVLSAGAVPGLALARSPVGLALSAPVVIAISAMGATIALATSTSAFGWSLAILIAANIVAAAWLLRRRVRSSPDSRLQWSLRSVGLAAWFTVPSLALLGLFPAPPVRWDARSIWWFHASWFLEDGRVYRSSLLNPLLAWSHPDYPPGNPAAIAMLWRLVGGGEDLVLAQALTAVLTALALAALGLLLFSASTGVPSLVAATVVVVAGTHLGHGLAAEGYVDVLAAAFVVASLVAYVGFPDHPASVSCGSLLLLAAASTKNEGLLFGVVAFALAIVFAPRARRLGVTLGGMVALALSGAWHLVVRSTGASIEGDFGSIGPGLLGRLREPEVHQRAVVALRHVSEELYPIVGPAVIAVLLLWAARRRMMRAEGTVHGALTTPSVLALAAVLCWIGTVALYAVGSPDLAYWFETSLGRVASTTKLLALASMAAAVGPGLAMLMAHRTPPPESGRPIPVTTTQEPEQEPAATGVQLTPGR